ncbi:DnaJ C-terminal domain-containing protein [Streptomyces sp. NPDC059866]|uniref:DnaJ C-terminal domain-containing protein n=1 Tax=Streptomyces sp. NPDC059866 TaxID=3346978 RepID=UPI00364C31DF
MAVTGSRGYGSWALLVFGVLVFLGGLSPFLTSGVGCGGQRMTESDTCVSTTVSANHVHSRTSDLTQQRSANRRLGVFGMVVGGATALGSGYMIRLQARARREGRPLRLQVVGQRGRFARLRPRRYDEPRHVRGVVRLRPAEAAASTTKTVEYRARVRCDHCHGTGKDGRKRCRVCRGSGLTGRVPQSVTIRVPAGMRDRSVVRVRGRGVPGRHPRPSGDLLLSVRLVSQGGASSRPAPERERAARESTSSAALPVTVTGNGVRFVVGPTGFLVQHEHRSATGRRDWVDHVELSWPDIADLSFDSDRHDAVVALYAVRAAGGRQHVVDSRALSTAQWQDVAKGVERLSGGRIILDLSRRDRPGGPRDS